jgi:autotransporter-associated beta strand protein
MKKNLLLATASLATLLLAFSVTPAMASTTWTVNSTADTNTGSGSSGTLRYALANAAAGDTITFSLSSGSTITLTSSLPVITNNLTINGSGAPNLTISGANTYQILQVSTIGAGSGPTVSISNLNLIDGKVTGGNGTNGGSNAHNGAGGGGGLGAGGAILVLDHANVSISNVGLNGNSATGGNGGNATSAGSANGGAGGGSGQNGGGAGGLGGGGGGGAGGGGFVGGGSGGTGAGGGGYSTVGSPGGGGGGGAGLGGAIFVSSSGTLTLTGVSEGTVSGNSATGGSAGAAVGYPQALPGGSGSGLGADLYSANGATVSGGTFADSIAGTGGVIVQGGTTTTFEHANTYTGGTTVSGSGTVLSISNDNQLGTGTVALGENTTFKTTTGGTYSHAITISGDPDFDVASGQTSTISSVIADGGSPGTLNKIDTGTLVLTGANTYTGETLVTAGTLRLSGASSDIADSSDVNVASGATLSNTTAQTIKNLQGSGSVTTSAALTVNETGGCSIFSGNITGTGSLTKTGSDMLVLNGSGNDYSGGTTVSGGTLEVGDISNPTASLTSDVTIASGGTLRGHGTIIGTVTNNGGIMAPGGSIGVTTITGNYVQSGGTLSIELNPSQTSKLAVSGSATFDGTLSITPDTGTYTRGTVYQILTATNVSGTFSTVVNTAPSNAAFGVVYNSGDVDLIVEGGATTFRTNAITINQKGVATALDNVSNGVTSGNLNTLLNNISMLSTSGQQQAFDELNGIIAADMQVANASNIRLMIAGVQSRLSGSPAAGATEVALVPNNGPFQVADADDSFWGPASAKAARVTAWMQGFGEFNSVSGDHVASGMSSSVGGGAIGVEAHDGIDDKVGIMFGAANDSLSVSGVSQSGTQNTYALGVYGSKGLGGGGDRGFVLDGMVLGAYNTATTDRTVSVIGETAHADTNGYGFGAEAGVGYPIVLEEDTILTPHAGLNYTYSYENGYTESGAPGANLTIGDKGQSFLQTALGITASHKFLLSYSDTTISSDAITPEVHVGWTHELLDPRAHVSESFLGVGGSGFTGYSASPGRDAAAVGGGFSFVPGDDKQLSIYMRYDAQVSHSESDHTVTAGLRYSF